LHVAPSPFWKRGLDLGIGALLALVAFPILAVAAVAIKCANGGPILFWQWRVGHGGREFWFPKLRSMHVGADALHDTLLSRNDHGDDSVTFKMRADPRVTRVGRILRTLSIDEIPQLWCVFRGEMSLVGPRPPLPSEVLRYTPAELRRLQVKPGITGLWQVSGRSNIGFEGQIALDLEYIERQGLATDLNILARTIRAVVSCNGAW
jgi:lipopolysaccharide/colanic/teichoic acid biosynthesis glycosyltransferase